MAKLKLPEHRAQLAAVQGKRQRHQQRWAAAVHHDDWEVALREIDKAVAAVEYFQATFDPAIAERDWGYARYMEGVVAGMERNREMREDTGFVLSRVRGSAKKARLLSQLADSFSPETSPRAERLRREAEERRQKDNATSRAIRKLERRRWLFSENFRPKTRLISLACPDCGASPMQVFRRRDPFVLGQSGAEASVQGAAIEVSCPHCDLGLGIHGKARVPQPSVRDSLVRQHVSVHTKPSQSMFPKGVASWAFAMNEPDSSGEIAQWLIVVDKLNPDYAWSVSKETKNQLSEFVAEGQGFPTPKAAYLSAINHVFGYALTTPHH
jgi:hypothetical protein